MEIIDSQNDSDLGRTFFTALFVVLSVESNNLNVTDLFWEICQLKFTVFALQYKSKTFDLVKQILWNI